MIDIYCHTNKINGKKYIGISVNGMNRRWRGHLSDAKRGEDWLFARAIRKYGEDSWIHEILEQVETLDEANKNEQKWINFYKSNNRKFGYNSKSGGEVSLHSEETKMKMSIIAKNRFIKNPSIKTKMSATRKSFSKEKINNIYSKISEKLKTKFSDEQFDKMKQMRLKGKTLKEIGRQFNVSRVTIRNRFKEINFVTPRLKG